MQKALRGYKEVQDIVPTIEEIPVWSLELFAQKIIRVTRQYI